MTEYNGSSGHKFEFLEQLSTEDLEYLLCLSSDAEETEAFFDAVAEVIVERENEHPTGRLPNVDDAWNEFQTLYNTSENLSQIDQDEGKPIPNPRESAPKIPRRSAFSSPRRLLPIAATVALTIVLTIGGMVGAQASGLNVFGALAEWTDEIFHFVPSSPSDSDTVKSSLQEHGIPEELAPTWVPERFEFQRVDSTSNEEGVSSTVGYTSGNDTLCIEIGKYNDPAYLVNWGYQKDSNNVETFISHERKFYIFTNLERTVATWSDGQSLIIGIWGNVSTEEMMDIISSIGG